MVERVTITPAQDTNAQAAHEAAMVAKVDAKMAEMTALANGTPAPAATERPAGLPEKFTSVEAMAAAYAELEKKFTQANQGTKPAAEETPPAQTAEKPADSLKVEEKAVPTDVAGVIQAAGLEAEALTKELEAGALSDASYEALAKAGYPKAVVDTYIAGQRALADAVVNDIYATVGGKETFTRMTDWAKTNLSAAEITTFNKMVEGSPDQVKLAVQGLHSRFTQAVGSEPTLISGQPAGAGDSFQSWAQVTAAMKDPRYRADPAFRKDVEARLARSGSL